ncbi:MAG TPA: hypothetical protein VFU29_04915 [Chitinophagaceae bacterium]|nr:hypothetical protein [Chitinophagaceae bacterium]
MELKAMDIAPYKKAYTGVLFICILSVAASFFIVRQGYAILANIPETKTVKDVIMYSMIGAALIFSFYQQKQKQKLLSFTDFDEKRAFYQKIFRSRLWWYALSCIVSALLLFLTARKIFFYFACFDLLVMLLTFPNKTFIKKELNEEELIIH